MQYQNILTLTTDHTVLLSAEVLGRSRVTTPVTVETAAAAISWPLLSDAGSLRLSAGASPSVGSDVEAESAANCWAAAAAAWASCSCCCC